MASQMYLEWLRALDKNDLRFFDDTNFRQDYTRRQLKSKAKLFENLVIEDVRTVLRDTWNHTDLNEIRILSLGCGPGSDLLGILGAVKAVVLRDSFIGWKNGELSCKCTGVDAFDWVWSDLEQLADGICSNNRDFKLELNPLIQEDMESFVCDSSISDGLIDEEYDFICLSFANAGSYLELIGCALPKLLSEFGRIVVLDTNIWSVRRLTNYGYRCTFENETFCILSSGQKRNNRRRKFRPSQNSPYARFCQHFSW